MPEETVATQTVETGNEGAADENVTGDLFSTPEAERLKTENPDAYKSFQSGYTQTRQREKQEIRDMQERLKKYEEVVPQYEDILNWLDEKAVESGYENIEAWKEAYENGKLTKSEETEFEDTMGDASPKEISELKTRLEKIESRTAAQEKQETISNTKNVVLSFRKELKKEYGEDDLDKYEENIVKLIPGLGRVLPPEEALRYAYYASKFPDIASSSKKAEETLKGIKEGQPPAITHGRVVPGVNSTRQSSQAQSILNILDAGIAAKADF